MGFDQETCCTCFVVFGVPGGYQAKRREDQKSFYCPNGHAQAYTQSQLDIVRRERDRLKQDAARQEDEIARLGRERDAAERRLKAAERKTKRIEKRAQAGLCPCCNRSFSELANHMATKHPDFRAEDVARENVLSLVKARA